MVAGRGHRGPPRRHDEEERIGLVPQLRLCHLSEIVAAQRVGKGLSLRARRSVRPPA